MVRIRLRRVGAKKQPSYRIVVIQSEAAATGRPIETIGHFNPRTEPETIVVKQDRALYWLQVGAQPSDPVLRLFKKLGIMDQLASLGTGRAEEPAEAPAAGPEPALVGDEAASDEEE